MDFIDGNKFPVELIPINIIKGLALSVFLGQLEGYVASQALKQRILFEITCERDLKLVDVTGRNLARLGLDGQISACGCHEYTHCRAWGNAIWQHPDNVDGIRYRCRHDDDLYSVGLFENRVDDSLRDNNLGNLMDNQPQLDLILEHYEYGLLL